MKYGDVVNLAWDLADSVCEVLPAPERTAMFALLGAGELDRTIEVVLHEFARARAELRPELVQQTNQWIGSYVEPGDQPRLRDLLQAATGHRGTRTVLGAATAIAGVPQGQTPPNLRRARGYRH